MKPQRLSARGVRVSIEQFLFIETPKNSPFRAIFKNRYRPIFFEEGFTAIGRPDAGGKVSQPNKVMMNSPLSIPFWPAQIGRRKRRSAANRYRIGLCSKS